MKYFLYDCILIISIQFIATVFVVFHRQSNISSLEDGPTAPEWPAQPKGMNGPYEYHGELTYF